MAERLGSTDRLTGRENRSAIEPRAREQARERRTNGTDRSGSRAFALYLPTNAENCKRPGLSR